MSAVLLAKQHRRPSLVRRAPAACVRFSGSSSDLLCIDSGDILRGSETKTPARPRTAFLKDRVEIRLAAGTAHAARYETIPQQYMSMLSEQRAAAAERCALLCC